MFGFCGCCGWRRPLVKEPIVEPRRRCCFCGCGWGRRYGELHNEREEVREHFHHMEEGFPRRRFY